MVIIAIQNSFEGVRTIMGHNEYRVLNLLTDTQHLWHPIANIYFFVFLPWL